MHETAMSVSAHALRCSCRVLTGGTTTCDVFSGADYYGKLSVVRPGVGRLNAPDQAATACTWILCVHLKDGACAHVCLAAQSAVQPVAQAWANGLNRFFAQPAALAPSAAAAAAAAPFPPPAPTIPPSQLLAVPGTAGPGPGSGPDPGPDAGPGAASPEPAAAPVAAAAANKPLSAQAGGPPPAAPPAGDPAAASSSGGVGGSDDAAGAPAGAVAAAPIALSGAAERDTGTGLNFYPNLLTFEANNTRTMLAY